MYGAPVPRITLRTLARLFLGGLTAAAAMLPAERASASSYLVIPPAAVAEASAAYKYANMTDVEALAELDKRKVPYKKAESIAGVVAPVRLTGKLHGVWIHSSIPESQRATSMYEVLDARLALALDDFAKILERHDIEEVVHYSLYRPNVPREHDEGAHVAARQLAADTRAAAAAKSPVASDTATTAAVAKAPAALAAAPAALGTKAGTANGSAAKHGVSGASTAKVGARPGPAAPAKSPPQGKPHGAKTALPAAPAKALPQPAGKGAPTAHGVKRKDPLVSDKQALPALPAPHAQAPKDPTAHAAAPHASSHAKVTATAKGAAPARTRVATPAKGAAPAKATSPVQAAATKAAPASAAGAKSAPPASAAKIATPATKIAAPAGAAKVATPAGAAKNAPAVVATKPAPAAPVSRQKWAPPGTRHPAGLAIDVALLKKRDGQWISVARDFQGKIGAKTCGDGVRTADTPEGRELRSLVCEANDLGVFTYVLTPNFNAAHYDHFHMEIRPTVKWFLYH